jgi:hypothetical protein
MTGHATYFGKMIWNMLMEEWLEEWTFMAPKTSFRGREAESGIQGSPPLADLLPGSPGNGSRGSTRRPRHRHGKLLTDNDPASPWLRPAWRLVGPHPPARRPAGDRAGLFPRRHHRGLQNSFGIPATGHPATGNPRFLGRRCTRWKTRAGTPTPSTHPMRKTGDRDYVTRYFYMHGPAAPAGWTRTTRTACACPICKPCFPTPCSSMSSAAPATTSTP